MRYEGTIAIDADSKGMVNRKQGGAEDIAQNNFCHPLNSIGPLNFNT